LEYSREDVIAGLDGRSAVGVWRRQGHELRATVAVPIGTRGVRRSMVGGDIAASLRAISGGLLARVLRLSKPTPTGT
jgi:hypothetical protein